MIKILNNQRGLCRIDGNFSKVLKPGNYYFSPLKKVTIEYLSIKEPFPYQNTDLTEFLEDPLLKAELVILTVLNHEIAVRYIDDRIDKVFTPGTYGFFEVGCKNTFKIIDMRNIQVSDDFDKNWLFLQGLKGYLVQVSVEAHEKALVFYDGVFQTLVEPGKYFYWNRFANITAIKVDLRQKQLEVAGQEILSGDKVPLRLSFVCQYKINDPVKVALTIKDMETQIYVLLQLILREYIGLYKLDELLSMKQDMGEFVLNKLKSREDDFGIQFLAAGLKDIILPGDIKNILNTVLIAQKQAQANVIMRQEEVASTRSLLNTAKLMEENPILMKLKELEYMEKICEKVGSINVSNSGNLLEKLGELIR